MRAVILAEPGRLETSQTPIPEPGDGEIVIKVQAATTCGTDLKAYQRGHPQIPMPGPLGHEYSGTVVSAGENAPFQIGDEVMGVHSAPCQKCLWCKAGQENLCESIMATKVLGAYAEFLKVPARIARLNVFHKPPELPFEVASLLEPLACVAQGVNELMRVVRWGQEKSVLVIGPGAIGLMFVGALKLLGVENVVLAGRNRARLEVGEKLGATAIQFADATPFEGRGYDAVIECTGQSEVWEQSIAFVRRGGVAMLFGGCKGGTQVSFDAGRLHYDQITILSPFHFGTEAVKTARDWLSDPRLDLSPLVTGRAALEDASQVFADLIAGKHIKVAFQP